MTWLAVSLAFAFRFQVDEKPALVERIIGAVNADIGGQADDIFIFQNGIGELLLVYRHRGVGGRLRGLGNALDDAGILHRKKSLWDINIHQNCDHQRDHRNQQR